MGQVYFKSIYYQHRGIPINNPPRRELEISSEELGEVLDYEDRFNFERFSLQSVINSSTGIFYYETNLWDKEELKRQLHKLVDEI